MAAPIVSQGEKNLIVQEKKKQKQVRYQQSQLLPFQAFYFLQFFLFVSPIKVDVCCNNYSPRQLDNVAADFRPLFLLQLLHKFAPTPVPSSMSIIYSLFL